MAPMAPMGSVNNNRIKAANRWHALSSTLQQEDVAQRIKNQEKLLARQAKSGLTGARGTGLQEVQPKIVEIWRKVVLHNNWGMVQCQVSSVRKVEHKETNAPCPQHVASCLLGTVTVGN